MGRVTVGKGQPQREGDVLVDRSTDVGNPFRMGWDGHDERYREAVCDAFEELILLPDTDPRTVASTRRIPDCCWPEEGRCGETAARARFAELVRLARRVQRGEDLQLLCHCAPKRCHGQALARRILWLATWLPPVESRVQATSLQARLPSPELAAVRVQRPHVVAAHWMPQRRPWRPPEPPQQMEPLLPEGPRQDGGSGPKNDRRS